MTALPRLHVAVLMGGWSSERPVSLTSGEGVASALEQRGHRVTRIDMGRDVALRLAEAAPDVVFNALHGTPGEDGTVQGMMDLMGLTYPFRPGHLGHRDRQGTDQAGAGAPWHSHARRARGQDRRTLRARSAARPYVLKPVNEGSSVGVAIVTAEGNYGNPISPQARGPWQEFDELLAEPFIRGRELTTAVLGDRR
jgi:D-alanine-D-alanine ligase